MRLNYGFTIPMKEYCKDIPGLIKYLGEKIGVGYTSIMDNKQFRSVEACQMHMRDTNTCKMLFENNEHEYEEFYDMNALIEIENKLNNVKLHDNGFELVVNNEKILGHRDLVVYYKQGVVYSPPENKIMKKTTRDENVKRQKRVNVDFKSQQRIMKIRTKAQFQTNNQFFYRPDNPL